MVRSAGSLLVAVSPAAVPLAMAWAVCATDSKFCVSCDAPARTSSALETVPVLTLFRFVFFFGVPSSLTPFTVGLFLFDPSDFRGFFAVVDSAFSGTGGGGGGAGLKYSYACDTVLCIGVCTYEMDIAFSFRRKDIVR